ncbi:MAG: LutC/YkgG family protein [Desulfitobacteriaceae bacterium]
MPTLEALFERFQEKLTAMAGECYRVVNAEEAGGLLVKLLLEKQVSSIALVESPLTQGGNFIEQLQGAGMTVFIDNYRTATPQVNAGITQLNWAIAELGTLVQIGTDVDQRLASMLPPIHVALIQTSKLLPTLMETLATIHSLPEIPGFVGFITGPSRTADIERVLTIGVHGPAQFIAVFVDEEVREVD